jgi:hypothetical protein
LTQKVKISSLIPSENDLKKSNSFSVKKYKSKKSTLLLREKSQGASVKRNILIQKRNRNDPKQIKEDKKDTKALISEISHSVKNNLKQSLDIERNPKKFILKEVKNLFQKHIENEKKEFNDMFKKLDDIYDHVVKEIIHKNLNV